MPLTVTLNNVNRSMGQPDLYPFVLSQPVMEKLDFIHALIHGTPAQQVAREAGWRALCGEDRVAA